MPGNRMKTLLSILILFAGLRSQAQNVFTQNRWSTNAIIGVKEFRIINYTSDIILDTLNQKYPYGYISEFLPDSTFLSYNIGWCGNECRTIAKGRYSIKGNTIELFVKSLSYSKECNGKPSEEMNVLFGVYLWKQEDSRLILMPAKS